MTPSPWMTRSTVKNRFGNQLARTPVANPGRRRSPRLQTRFTLFAPHAANRSPTPGSPGDPPHPRPSDGGVAGAERRSRGSHQPPTASSARARTSRFSAASNRSEAPAIPPPLGPTCGRGLRYGHFVTRLKRRAVYAPAACVSSCGAGARRRARRRRRLSMKT
jgi:hypothetical protein